MARTDRENSHTEFAGDGGALRSPGKWPGTNSDDINWPCGYVGVDFPAPLCHICRLLRPYSELTTDRRRTYHSPTKIHIFHEGKLVRPFVYGYTRVDTLRNIYEEDKSTMYPIYFFVRGDKYNILGIESDLRLFGVEAPGKIYLMGADRYGRDIFSRLAYGGRRSLFIGIIGLVISLSIGMIYGGVSGYFGGCRQPDDEDLGDNYLHTRVLSALGAQCHLTA